mmetsp:Transcript_14184/g.30966  ORF Transcript_14184/g.30966 Transcript_14184/m.30966 type:complete len:345 (-) Transcript_14184:128-1162(-)
MRTLGFDGKSYRGLQGLGLHPYASDSQQQQLQRDASSSSSQVTADGQPIKETPRQGSHRSIAAIEEDDGRSSSSSSNATSAAAATTSRKRLRFDETANVSHEADFECDSEEVFTVFWYKREDYVTFKRNIVDSTEFLVKMEALLHHSPQHSSFLKTMHEAYQQCCIVPDVVPAAETASTNAETSVSSSSSPSPHMNNSINDNTTILNPHPNTDASHESEEDSDDLRFDPTLQSALRALCLDDDSRKQQPQPPQPYADYRVGLEKLALLNHYKRDTDQRRERLRVLVKQIQDNYVWASQVEMAHVIASVCQRISLPHVRFAAILGQTQRDDFAQRNQQRSSVEDG